VILTQTLDAPDQAAGRRVAGETVLGDVRVIAVDQQLVQGGQASNMLDGHSPSSRTITLEVSSRDAARIAVATRLGKLQVVLLSARPGAPQTGEAQSGETKAGTTQAELAPVAVASPPASKGMAPVAPGPVWGGDVSAALGRGSGQGNVEVRLFQGTKPVEAYRF
jgi:pilus assembly protein CpaB